jgi:hypothetical protein
MLIVKDGRLVEAGHQMTEAEFAQAVLDSAQVNPAAMSAFYDGTRPSDQTAELARLSAKAAIAKAEKHAEEHAAIDRANRIAATDAGNVSTRPAPTSGSEYRQRTNALRELVGQVYGGDRYLAVLPGQDGVAFPALAICHLTGTPEYMGSVDALERRVDLDRREFDMRKRQEQATTEYQAQKSRELHEAQMAAYENPVTAQLRAENAQLRDELAEIKALVLAQQAPAVTPEPSPEPAIVVDEPADEAPRDEFSLVETLKARQAAVLARFRSS